MNDSIPIMPSSFCSEVSSCLKLCAFASLPEIFCALAAAKLLCGLLFES